MQEHYGPQWAEQIAARALIYYIQHPHYNKQRYIPMQVWEAMSGKDFTYSGAMYEVSPAMRRNLLIVCVQLTTESSARYYEKWYVWTFMQYFSPRQQETILTLLQNEVKP